MSGRSQSVTEGSIIYIDAWNSGNQMEPRPYFAILHPRQYLQCKWSERNGSQIFGQSTKCNYFIEHSHLKYISNYQFVLLVAGNLVEFPINFSNSK